MSAPLLESHGRCHHGPSDLIFSTLAPYKIFSITKYFQNDFFPCLVAFRKIFYNVVQKIKQKGQRVRRAFLENGLQKNWA